jgi:hypothetical protein
LEAERTDKPCFRKGRRVHTATLEPHRWGEFYGSPDLSQCKTAKGVPTTSPAADSVKDAIAKWRTDNPRMEEVTDAQRDLAFRTAAAVSVHPQAAAVLSDCDDREVVFEAPINGIAAKCQADLFGKRSGTLGDLKTIGKMMTERALQRQIMDYGYHGQFALYRRVMRAAGFTVNRCVLIFVETAAPHDVAVVEIGEEWLALGEELVDTALAAYAEVQAGRVVGRFPGVVALDVPTWAFADDANSDDVEGLGLEGVEDGGE